MPQIGETIYYRRDSNEFVQKAIFMGETSRSWLVGTESMRYLLDCPDSIAKLATKLPKKDVRFETGEAYELSVWASAHRWKIREAVNFASPEALKKIAELVDYKG